MTNQTEHHAEAILRDVRPAAWMYVHLDYAGRRVCRYGVHAERVNGHDPVERHPLYPASAILDAVRAERAAIVAWLRTRWNDGPDFLADLIERGEHLPQDTPK